MAEQIVAQTSSFLAIALLDSADQVVAINDEWRKLNSAAERVTVGSRLAELTRIIPELAEWLNHSGERREIHRDGWQLHLQLLKLEGEHADRILIVNARPFTDEDAYGRLRHDIKNRIGGLKLYATFLKRKLGDQTELLDVVGKMINSLDQMTAEANKIRNLEGDCK